MPRIPTSGSKVHRAWKCPTSLLLAHDVDDTAEERSEPARNRGKAIHKYLESVQKVGKSQALAEAPVDLAVLLESLDLARLPVHLITEIAFAYNWRTFAARELGRNLGHRNYDTLDSPPTDDEIPITVDLVGVQDMKGVLRGYVGDYKSGHMTYPSPEKYGQLLLGAACVRSVFKCSEVIVELIHIHSDGGSHGVRGKVDDWDLEAFSEELRTSFETVDSRLENTDYSEAQHLPTHAGAWCDYCPSYKHCNSKTALVRSIPETLYQLGARKDPDKEGLVVDATAITVANAARAWIALEYIEDVIGKMKGEICGLAMREAIPLPDGRVIGMIESERRSLDGKIAAVALEKRFGRPAALEAIKIETSMEAVRKVVGRYRKEGEKISTKDGTGVLDEVLGEISRAGGLNTKPIRACRPHLPKKLAGGS